MRGRIWYDEANEIEVASGNWHHIVEMQLYDNAPPLHHFLLAGWMRLVGRDELLLRATSVVAGLALVALVYAVGRCWLGPRAALCSALVAACSPLAVLYSHEIRPYALLADLTLGAAFCLERLLTQGRVRWAVGYVACTWAAFFTHYIALLELLALGLVASWWCWGPGSRTHAVEAKPQNLGEGLPPGEEASQAARVTLSNPPRRASWRRFVAAQAMVVGGLALWTPKLLGQVAHLDSYYFVLGLWNLFGPAGLLLRSLQAFTAALLPPWLVSVAQTPGRDPVPGGEASAWALLLFQTGLVVWGLWCGGNNRQETQTDETKTPRGAQHLGVILLTACYLLPLCLLALSGYRQPVWIPGRTDFMVFGFWCLLVGHGVATLSRRVPGLVLVLVAVLACGALVPRFVAYRDDPDRQIDAGVAQWLRNRLAPGDVVLLTSRLGPALRYGLDGALSPSHLLACPERYLYLLPEDIEHDAPGVVRRAQALLRTPPPGQVAHLWVAVEAGGPCVPVLSPLLEPEFERDNPPEGVLEFRQNKFNNHCQLFRLRLRTRTPAKRIPTEVQP